MPKCWILVDQRGGIVTCMMLACGLLMLAQSTEEIGVITPAWLVKQTEEKGKVRAETWGADTLRGPPATLSSILRRLP